MIRVLIFILSVVLVAGAITYFANLSEWVRAEAFGAKITFHAGAAMAAGLVSVLLLILFTAWFKDLAGVPEKLRVREREAKRARGIAALTRGLEAVAVGDAADAQHHARVAHRNLDDAALTRLLTAQAAQLAGDEKTAGESFAAMLEAPETEFLGLRGLYAKAVRQGDKTTAASYAERAFKLRPNAKWAFESVFDLGLERGAWGETRTAVATALKNKVIEPERARRADVALLTADAYAADLAGDASHALEEAEAALKLEPGFAPAAVLAAERHRAAGRAARAARILEQAFAATPHAGLIAAHEKLFADAAPAERAAQLARIAERNPTAREAKLAAARRSVLLGDFAAAIALLEPLLIEKATAPEEAAMAEAVAGAYGPDAAKKWLEKAAAAPRDATPGLDGAFHFTRDGWARLVREYMDYGRLAPPPLEDAPRGLSFDELKRLAPPKPPAAATSPTGSVSSEATAEPPPAAAQSGEAASEQVLSQTDGENAATAARNAGV